VNHAAKFDLSITKEEIEVDAIDTAKDADSEEFCIGNPVDMNG